MSDIFDADGKDDLPSLDKSLSKDAAKDAANGDTEDHLIPEVSGHNHNEEQKDPDIRISINAAPEDSEATANTANSPGDGNGERPESTEGSVSFRARSQGSVSESVTSASSAIRTAQRNYLSPLRSKRYDGLRSSLLSPSVSRRPSYLTSHSRSSSMASMKQLSQLADDCTTADLAETIKWTRLKKITTQLYSESGRKAFGRPTCLAVAGVLVVGTSKGLLLVFDYQQACKHIIGSGTEAVHSGPVSAVALSADHTFVVAGHEDGAIYSWDLASPATPSKTIAPVSALTSGTKGHIRGTRIASIDFVGTRHSAFVSADDTGLVFYHSFSRKMLFNVVESSRILGRYPDAEPSIKLKPSVTYASSILPLGNLSSFSDTIGLVAIITPYKLVLVSTVPVPRTQFRLNRTSGALASATVVSACAAWYPAMTEAENGETSTVSRQRPVLAFAWCSHLQFLTIEQENDVRVDDSMPAPIIRLTANLLGQYVCPESLVAMQWYSRSLLCLLTSTSHLLVFDTVALQIIGRCDLLGKQIVHHDVYRERLKAYFELREAEYVDQTFADSYASSFHIYKGKSFLLGAHDLYVGSMLTWADKLLALISAGQHIEAIKLLLAYYAGSVELSGLRLPASTQHRQAKLEPKIYDTMLSSIRFSLGSEDLAVRSDSYHRQLIDICLEACLQLQNTNFFVNEIYDEYEEVDRTEPFLERLASSILDDQIVDVPPSVVRELVRYFIEQRLHTRLEDVICHLNPTVLDINQIIGLCREHDLYNASTYVHTEALQDFKSPFFDYVTLIKVIFRTSHLAQSTQQEQNRDDDMLALGATTVNAVKIFPFISATLTGRVFPNANDRSPELVAFGRSQILEILFSGTTVAWPADSNELVLSELEDPEPDFPYLRLLLLFDCPTFLASMDEAFEDSSLNDVLEVQGHSLSRTISVTRQFIVNLLLEVMNTGFEPEDTIYLYMFIARNVPKYPQFILLSGSILQRIILGLCQYTDIEMAEDCQLSVEYLLSVYKPADPLAMLEHYRTAGFYRVLKTHYRADQNWPQLLLAELRDEASEDAVFSCITEFLGSDSILSSQQKIAVQAIILDQVVAITSLNGSRAAEIIELHAPELQSSIIDALLTRDGLLYIYLKQIMDMPSTKQWMTPSIRAKFVDLLCVYDRQHLLEYLRSLKTGDVHVDAVVDNLEKYDLVDAIVELVSGQGDREQALANVIRALQTALDVANNDESEDLQKFSAMQRALDKYACMGAGLCEVETTASHEELYGTMWVDLLQVIVNSCSTFNVALQQQNRLKPARIQQFRDESREILQRTCSQLFVSTYSRSANSTVLVLRSWFIRMQSSGQDLLLVQLMLSDLFGSYKFYHQLLALAQAVIGGDLYTDFTAGVIAGNRGWSVVPYSCCICDEPLGDIKREHTTYQQTTAAHRAERLRERQSKVERLHGLQRLNAGKRPIHATSRSQSYNNSHVSTNEPIEEQHKTKIISHACGHLSHEECYRALTRQSESIVCPKCDHEERNALLDGRSSPPETLHDEELIPARY